MLEFKDEACAKAFELPAWFADDVTFDKRFKNNYIALAETIDVEDMMR